MNSDETPPYDDEEDYSSEHDHSEDYKWQNYQDGVPKPINEKSDTSEVDVSHSDENSSDQNSIPEEHLTP